MRPSTNAKNPAVAPQPRRRRQSERASAAAVNGDAAAGARPAPQTKTAVAARQPTTKLVQQPRRPRGAEPRSAKGAAAAAQSSAQPVLVVTAVKPTLAAPEPAVAAPAAPATVPPPPSACDVCGLKRHLAALQAQLADARKAARPPAISSLTTTALPAAALQSVLLDAVHRAAELKLASEFKPEHLCLFPHDADVPVVRRFLAGVAAATEGRVASVEDVLRLPVDAAVDPHRPDEPAVAAGRGRGRGGRRNRGGRGGGTDGSPDNLNNVQAGSPLHFVAFHGTRTSDALRGITVGGWDPKFRSGQALGPGEYFGRHPSTASGYDSLGSCVVVALLLRVPELVTNRQATESVVVVANPPDLEAAGQTYCLPIGLYGEKAPRQLAQVVAWRTAAADAAREARLERERADAAAAAEATLLEAAADCRAGSKQAAAAAAGTLVRYAMSVFGRGGGGTKGSSAPPRRGTTATASCSMSRESSM